MGKKNIKAMPYDDDSQISDELEVKDDNFLEESEGEESENLELNEDEPRDPHEDDEDSQEDFMSSLYERYNTGEYSL